MSLYVRTFGNTRALDRLLESWFDGTSEAPSKQAVQGGTVRPRKRTERKFDPKYQDKEPKAIGSPTMDALKRFHGKAMEFHRLAQAGGPQAKMYAHLRDKMMNDIVSA